MTALALGRWASSNLPTLSLLRREGFGDLPLSPVGLGSMGAIGVSAACDTDNGDAVSSLVDSIDHPVGTSAGAVPVLECGPEPLADAMGVIQQRTHNKLVSGEGNRLG
jgi:hypothetical protein